MTESTTHQLFATSTLHTKYPDYFTNSTNQKYVSVIAVHLFRDDPGLEELVNHKRSLPSDIDPEAAYNEIFEQCGCGMEDFPDWIEPYKSSILSAVRYPQLEETPLTGTKIDPETGNREFIIQTDHKLLAGSVFYFTFTDGSGSFVVVLKDDDLFAIYPPFLREDNVVFGGGFVKETNGFCFYRLIMNPTSPNIDNTAEGQKFWLFYDPQADPAPVEPSTSDSFFVPQYCQFHADFVQDDECLQQYVCMANLPLYHKRKYKQYNNPRFFDVWFTDYKGTKIEFDSSYHFVLELLLEY